MSVDTTPVRVSLTHLACVLAFVCGGCSGPSAEPPKYRPPSNEIAAPPSKADQPAAVDPAPEPDPFDEPIERADDPTWWCTCYKREIAGEPEPVTACRRQETECLALQKAVAKGGRDMLRGSTTHACQSVVATHPGDAHGGREVWQPSKKAGAWVSNGKCQLGESNDGDEADDAFALMHAESVGPLKIGMGAAEVVKHVGEPPKRDAREMSPADGAFHQPWSYPDQGLVIVMESVEAKSAQHVGSVRIVAPSTLKTARGITIGSPRDEVLEHYGAQRDLDHTDLDGDDPQFIAGSIYGGLVFQFENDQVSEIFLGAAAE